MITAAQRDIIRQRAYVPEHLLDYVTSITRAEPFLIEDYLVYTRRGWLLFVGYALSEDRNLARDEERMLRAFEQARAQFSPEVISVDSPALPPAMERDCSACSGPDHYYFLELAGLSLGKKLRNLLKRAGRELIVERGKDLEREHKRLIQDFIRSHPLQQGLAQIYRRLPEYVESGAAWVISARDERGKLSAFDIADFNSQDYAFYLFNFRSCQNYVPGASDLLLSSIIEQARLEGKKAINLGLGINPGVTFFKTKWGGSADLLHWTCIHETPRDERFDSMLDKL